MRTVVLVFIGCVVAPELVSAQIETEVFMSGFSGPVFVTAPAGDPRLFVVEQDGLIRIVENGAILGTPFLDLTGVTNRNGERGLFCMAFHPDYGSNGLFYVHYTAVSNGDTTLVEYQVSGNPNVADAGSANVLLTEPQPYPNHNGGMIAFKPGEAGNYLYVALGDGGDGGDPDERAQDLDTILGSIIRLDVDNNGLPPASNPFVGQAGDDRIWVYGLRNPWRFSFDRLTGDVYIGDVGQFDVEEVDFLPASSTGGENFGWDLLEGSADFECTDCDGDRMNTVLPIHEYTHTDGDSITGGNVYRGSDYPSLQGVYFFADLRGRFWSFRYDGANLSEFQEHTTGFPVGQTIVSFGEDGDGELYIVGHGGTIYRIIDASPAVVDSTSGGGLHEEGEVVTLSASVSGTVGMTTYAWFKDGAGSPLSDGGNVSGASTSDLTFSPVALADSGSYVLEVTDEAKSVTVAPAIVLTVVAAGALPVAGWAGLFVAMVFLAGGFVYLVRGRRIQHR